MIFENDNKVLVVDQRPLETDEIRFIVGVVDAYEAGTVKVSGHSWIRDPVAGAIISKPGLRTSVFSLASGTPIVCQLPTAVVLKRLCFEEKQDGSFWLNDGSDFQMDLTEKVHARAARKLR